MTDDLEKRAYKRGRRWWLDARTHQDVGGDREPLRENGSTLATTDKARAIELAKTRMAELEYLRLACQTKGLEKAIKLREAARDWLIHLARDTDLDDATIEGYEWAARWIITLIKGNPHLHEITTQQARALRKDVSKAISRRTGRTLSLRSRRYVLKTLEMILDWGQTEGTVPGGDNPITPALKRMRVTNKQTPYFEPVEVAAFLQGLIDAADTVTAQVLLSFIWALTGCRRTGGRGLLVEDVDLHHGLVRFECNAWRKIKGRQLGHRSVPIWPLLALALRAYQPPFEQRRGHLACPTISRGGDESMVSDFRSLWRKAQAKAIEILDEAGVEHNLRQHRMTPRALRVAYASARVQTLDRGEPVSDRTVSYELGHQSKQMLDRVYVRIGKSMHRQRHPVVEYRLPSGRLPGEELFRTLLGDAEVDLISAIETPVSVDVFERLGLPLESPDVE
jgi:integrase